MTDQTQLQRNGEMIRDLMVLIGDANQVDAIPDMVQVILHQDSWRERMILSSGEVVQFDSFEDFVTTPPLEGLGMPMDKLYRYCKDTPAKRAIEDAVKASKKHGTNQYNNSGGYMSPPKQTKRGNSRPYIIKRLKRDDPELARRVIEGELTASEAARQAGFNPPKAQIRLDDMQSAANSIINKLDSDQLGELIDHLLEHYNQHDD